MDAIALLEEKADYVAGRLALLANAKRLLILCYLSQGEASVGAIQRTVGMSQSALSQHLARLREAGIVATRRDAQTVYYRLDDAETATLLGALCDTFCPGVHAETARQADA